MGLKMQLRQVGHGVRLSWSPIADMEQGASIEMGIFEAGKATVIVVFGVIVGRALTTRRLRVHREPSRYVVDISNVIESPIATFESYWSYRGSASFATARFCLLITAIVLTTQQFYTLE